MAESGKFTCVNCGEILYERSCKLRCPRCGYFEDCSDGTSNSTNFHTSGKDFSSFKNQK